MGESNKFRTMTIKGQARPKGSWNAIPVKGKIRFIPASTVAAKWFKYLETEVKKKWKVKTPWGGAIEVKIIFKLPRPKTNKDKYPIKNPDTDKLIRAILDAMTGVVYNDDSQVIEVTGKKVYQEDNKTPEVIIKVKRILG